MAIPVELRGGVRGAFADQQDAPTGFGDGLGAAGGELARTHGNHCDHPLTLPPGQSRAPVVPRWGDDIPGSARDRRRQGHRRGHRPTDGG